MIIEKGRCPRCARLITLTKRGVIRHHGAKDGSWPPRRCEGTGETPVLVTKEEK